MKSAFPKYPQKMRDQAKRWQRGVTISVPGMMAFEAKYALKNYYGSYSRAGFVMIREAIWMGLHGAYWSVVYRFCDLVGWTKLVCVDPERPEIKWRHGGKCSYLNCSDMDCIDKSVPQWFRKLARWEE